MELMNADYVIVAATLAAAILGAFIGFSGSLAFLGGTTVGLLAGKVAWIWSAGRLDAAWMRALAVLAVALVVFGLVRWAVRKIVSGLLHQPADALFGLLVAAFTGFAIAAAAVFGINYSGLAQVESTLVGQVVGFVGSAE